MKESKLPLTKTSDKHRYLNFACDCRKLTMQEYGVYCALIRFLNDDFGYSFPPYNVLMECLNITSRNTLSNHINTLIEKGFIIKIKGGNGMNNRYYFVDPDHINLNNIKEKRKQNGKESNMYPF